MAEGIEKGGGCQGASKHGPCSNKPVPDGIYCPIHGGATELKVKERKSLMSYRLDKWNSRINHHTEHEKLKSIRAEIGILRMMLEEKLSQCHDGHALMLQSQAITNLVLGIKQTVEACHKLEKSQGILLDKQAVLTFASDVIEIVGDVITDEAQLEEISNRIVQSVASDQS